MTNDEVKLKINQLLESLSEKEKRLRMWAVVVGAPVFAGILLLAFLQSRGATPEWNYWIMAIMLSLFLAFATGAAVFWAAILPEEKRVRESYIAIFSSKEARLVADRMLADIPERESNLETLSRLRRKLGIILRQFKCHACGSYVKIEHIDQRLQCPHCMIELVVPRDFPCPYCGERNTRVISPEEQVPPVREREATMGGGLIYGPAGLIAGSILDAIYRPFKLGFRRLRVATKAYVFFCDKCFHTWATTLQSSESDR